MKSVSLLETLISNFNYTEKEARAVIMTGRVLVNNEPIIISSHKISKSDIVRIKNIDKWVSRGAFKLLEAINCFKINLKNKICLDIGASKGGFTQVLLEFGAQKIYALDSGTNQLDYSLRINPKIVCLEKTNLKSINKNFFSSKLNFICADVSFISVKNIFNVLKQEFLANNVEIICLIKPQFEAPYSLVEKGGYVDEIHHKSIINNIIDYAKEKGFDLLKIIKSPILGNKSKNIEYLGYFKIKN